MQLSYNGAAITHLKKLDAVQTRAEKMAKSNFQSLQGRRDAGIFGLTCKILDGKAIESLQDEFSWCQPYIVEDVKRSTRLSTSMAGRVQIPSLLNVHRKQSVESYRRSCGCRMADKGGLKYRGFFINICGQK